LILIKCLINSVGNTGYPGCHAGYIMILPGYVCFILSKKSVFIFDDCAGILMTKAKNDIRWSEEIGIKDIPLVGGKNASLGEMYRELTPPGVAGTTDRTNNYGAYGFY